MTSPSTGSQRKILLPMTFGDYYAFMIAKLTGRTATILTLVGLSLVNGAGFATLFLSGFSEPQTEVCATHDKSCACPKACAALRKQDVESCHLSGARNRSDAGERSASSSCLLKAGCGKQELLASFNPFLKHFFPEERIRPNVIFHTSILRAESLSTISLAPVFQFFHPPRSS